MSNLVYPVLPGLKWSTFRTPLWNTTLKSTDSGREFARRAYSSPRYSYKLQYEFLRAGAEQEFQQLLAFFNRHGGDYDTWLFDDPSDNTAVDQQFGTGDGVTTQFQLLRSLGGFAEPVYELNGAAAVKVGGSVATPTVGQHTGLVTFATPPAAGAVLTASFAFYWRCRFAKSQLEFEQFMNRLWAAKSVEFKTVKP